MPKQQQMTLSEQETKNFVYKINKFASLFKSVTAKWHRQKSPSVNCVINVINFHVVKSDRKLYNNYSIRITLFNNFVVSVSCSRKGKDSIW